MSSKRRKMLKRNAGRKADKARTQARESARAYRAECAEKKAQALS